MKVEYISHMGDDLMVVNAARVSYGKQKAVLDDGDIRLIKYLAEHNHWTPFAHPQISLRMTTPIFVARQLFRHEVGLVINEMSRRYVDDTPTFDVPTVWRGRPGKGQSKQGSSEPLSERGQQFANEHVQWIIEQAELVYNLLIGEGVAPEQARVVLPLALETQWIWTGSLYAFARICRQRLCHDAQGETGEVAREIAAIVRHLFPHSLDALMDGVE